MPGQLLTGEWTLTCAAAVYQGEPQSGQEFWAAGAEGLTVRPRRTGDRLERPGRPGRTVKKIMIDQKLPRHLRDTVPVLDSGGRVAAVAELGPDAAFLPRLGEPCWHITAKRKGEYFMLEKDIQEILFSEEQLAQRVKEIAGEINRDYVGQEIMLVSVLRGSFVFMADLCRRIDLPCTVDFMAVSSYGGGPPPAARCRSPRTVSDITGKNIIVVEDILDSGNTLSYLRRCWSSAARPPSGCVPCWTSRSAGSSQWRSTTPASPFQTPLWWAMGWITQSITGTCPTSAS